LRRILPYFSFLPFDSESRDIEKFLKINRELRQENNLTLYNLRTETSQERLWNGTWVRLKNAATMARFADRRLYYYEGKRVDQQAHSGMDLASLANSEAQAANNGRVIFADRLGIYGLTVVLDHGQGLASVYSHLSTMSVELGQEVMKGEVVGLTGQTGLAGGDHLHFGIMVSGVFVNPIEWWDSHWIQDNVIRKLAVLEK
jgi:murein DD-endopeptidase MepM/ murein hydrolase activator NlpD